MIKLGRNHANFDTMKANNFNVQGPGGGVLDGKHGKWQKIYALVFLVADLLDKFSGPYLRRGTGSCLRQNPKN
jgi:hypothetical protein